jgi:hypothetical protein
MRDILISFLLTLLLLNLLMPHNAFAKVKVSTEGMINSEGVIIVDPMLDDSWITDQPTFNYRVPCDMDKINAVVIFVHGTNQVDYLKNRNNNNVPITVADMSSTYPNFDKFCVITAIPKSEVGSLSGLEGTPRFYRRWWMSKGDSLGHTTDADEIKAIINLIELAKDAVKKPIFLAMGHDKGRLVSKIIASVGADFYTDGTLTGLVYVDATSGEFAAHFFNGTLWLSEEH